MLVVLLLVPVVHDGVAVGAAVPDAEGSSDDRVGRLEGDAHAGVEGANAAAPGHLFGRGV